MNNLKQFGQILQIYAMDHDDNGPSNTYWGSGQAYSTSALLNYLSGCTQMSFTPPGSEIKTLQCPDMSGTMVRGGQSCHGGKWNSRYIFSHYGLCFGTGDYTNQPNDWGWLYQGPAKCSGMRGFPCIFNLRLLGTSVKTTYHTIAIPGSGRMPMAGDLSKYPFSPPFGYSSQADAVPHVSGSNTLFCDGHVAWISRGSASCNVYLSGNQLLAD